MPLGPYQGASLCKCVLSPPPPPLLPSPAPHPQHSPWRPRQQWRVSSRPGHPHHHRHCHRRHCCHHSSSALPPLHGNGCSSQHMPLLLLLHHHCPPVTAAALHVSCRLSHPNCPPWSISCINPLWDIALAATTLHSNATFDASIAHIDHIAHCVPQCNGRQPPIALKGQCPPTTLAPFHKIEP